jgi:hypothetical protein
MKVEQKKHPCFPLPLILLNTWANAVSLSVCQLRKIVAEVSWSSAPDAVSSSPRTKISDFNTPKDVSFLPPSPYPLLFALLLKVGG